MITYAISKTLLSRMHLVLAPGAYVQNVYLVPQNTPAPRIYIHGGGATLSSATPENATLFMQLASTIRDLKMSGPGSNAAINLIGGPHVLERITIDNAYAGIGLAGPVTARDISIGNTIGQSGIVLTAGAQLELERAVIHGGTYGVRTGDFGTTANLTNVLIWGTTDLAVDLPNNTGGSINSSTIVDSGTDTGVGSRAVRCTASLTVRSSIIWAPGATSRVAIEGCNLVNTVAGPTFVAGASNSDPLFVDRVGHDYHLSSSSPARDAVDTGPATDFEGDPRPRGVRFDIGADEAAP